ncbi:hypothetical protein LY76DRAFT_283497 [Colletotrichum caudatum]|nr:hypothetical protein LY76DRAFT_283497 [Colletotrichum caudatum]
MCTYRKALTPVCLFLPSLSHGFFYIPQNTVAFLRRSTPIHIVSTGQTPFRPFCNVPTTWPAESRDKVLRDGPASLSLIQTLHLFSSGSSSQCILHRHDHVNARVRQVKDELFRIGWQTRSYGRGVARIMNGLKSWICSFKQLCLDYRHHLQQLDPSRRATCYRNPA